MWAVAPSPPKRKKPEPGLRAQALKLLARREHSSQELARKLADADPEELAAVLDDFEQRGWLSEARVIEQVVHARRRRYGMQRIRQDLLAKGIAEESIDARMAELAAGELDAAREVWRRKFPAAPENAPERARQIRFLQGRGFTLETIMQILKPGGDDQ